MKKSKILQKLSEHYGIPLDYLIDSHLYAPTGSALRFSFCHEAGDAENYLQSFEQSIQVLIDAQSEGGDFDAYIVIDSEAIENNEVPSYRAALKKYSNAILFEDLRIGVLLIGAKKTVELLPDEVNEYLQNLDKYIRGT